MASVEEYDTIVPLNSLKLERLLDNSISFSLQADFTDLETERKTAVFQLESFPKLSFDVLKSHEVIDLFTYLLDSVSLRNTKYIDSYICFALKNPNHRYPKIYGFRHFERKNVGRHSVLTLG